MPDAMSIAVPRGEGSSKGSVQNVTFYWKADRDSKEGKLYDAVRQRFDMQESFVKFLNYLNSQPKA